MTSAGVMNSIGMEWLGLNSLFKRAAPASTASARRKERCTTVAEAAASRRGTSREYLLPPRDSCRRMSHPEASLTSFHLYPPLPSSVFVARPPRRFPFPFHPLLLLLPQR